MFRSCLTLACVMTIALSQSPLCQARGGGGGFHGGGGGFHGGGFGGGGFGGGGFGGGGFGGRGDFGGGGFGGRGDFGGGYRGGGFDGYRGGAGGYRPGELGGGARGDLGHAETFRNPYVNHGAHTGLPSDFGFGHVGARGYAAAGHYTHPFTPGSMAARGRDVRNNFWHHDWYNHDWWRNHPGAWFAAGWGLGTAWNWATWPALGAWYGWGNVQPIYYDYGNNITYDDDQVYYGDQPVASAQQYYDQASNLATSAPPDKGKDDEWQPLGVFGLVQGDQSDTSAVFQLAVNKSGAIGGNFADMLSGSNLVVHGAVDQKTQRAAWTVGDNKQTVYEAGIYNLTQEEAPVLVHYGSDRTQQWTLVRLKQPEGQNADSGDAPRANDGDSTATPPPPSPSEF